MLEIKSGYINTTCRVCGDDIEPPERAHIKSVCLFCGEEAARQERTSWCIIQEYTKGAYQFVTNTSAYTTLKQTNPKELRA